MSLYNMTQGVNLATFIILPMLGEKHYSEYPRFRNCFISEGNKICIYTRVGGNNRNCGLGEEDLYNHPNYIGTEDDEFDSTYAKYYFSVPNKWINDFNKIVNGELKHISDEYKNVLYKVYPRLKGQFDIIFGS